MAKQRSAALPALITLVALVASSQVCSTSVGQTVDGTPVQFRVSGPAQRLEMVVHTSRILTMDYKVPKLLVQNPDIVQATPLSPNQVQVAAKRTGVTALNLWDEKGAVYTVDLIVTGDARELEQILAVNFPDAALRVRPLANSAVVAGYVPSADMVRPVISIAEDFYPNVINNIRVGGVQTVLLHTRLMEVSRTKMRAMGFDWAYLSGKTEIVQSVSGLISSVASGGTGGTTINTASNETVRFGIVDGGSSFFGFLELLQQKNLIKVLAEPTVVTVSGRPASFSSGGEFPIVVPQSLGTVSIEYRQFGTRVDYVPMVLGNGKLRLEVRPSVSEIDPSRGVSLNGITVPGLRNRWVDTGVEMSAGQTLALAGLIQSRVESENRGLPFLADLPWVGAAFRRVEEQNNEIELLITVTPEFVSDMDPEEVPQNAPGTSTGSPDDHELYFRGYLEVPRCADGNCGTQGMSAGPVYQGEEIPAAHHNSGPPLNVAPPTVEASSKRLPPVLGPAEINPSAMNRPRARKSAPGLIGPVGYEQIK